MTSTTTLLAILPRLRRLAANEPDGVLIAIDEIESALRTKPVTVTVRHPDHGNEHHSFGTEVEVIDIDMGASFDGGHLGEGEWDTVLDWARGLYQEADQCSNPEAADFIRSVAEETLAECLPFGFTSCEVSRYITGTPCPNCGRTAPRQPGSACDVCGNPGDE